MLDHLITHFYLPKSKRLKSGEVPVYCRITLNGNRATFSTGIYVYEDCWNAKIKQVHPTDASAHLVNPRLFKIQEKVQQTYFKLESLNKEITATTLVDNLLNRKKKEEKARSLFALFENHNKKVKSLVPAEYAPGTYERYCTTLKHIKDFVKIKYKANDFALMDVNNEFITEFDFYLRATRKCNNNSTVKYLKNFKKIIRIALANNWIDRDPFLNYKNKLEKVDRGYLTVDELNKLGQKHFTIIRLEQVKDLFLFQCYTGLAYIDAQKLNKEHLVKDENGIQWIRTRRTKTDTAINIPLLPKAAEIINKYRDFNHNGQLLPKLSNQKMNAYLKEIADLCAIEKNLSSHLARHTFATVVTLANGVSIESVSKMLGHSNLNTTKIYARMLDSRVLEEMQLLTKKLQDK